MTGRLIQTRECVHPANLYRAWKLIELKELLWETEATGIICDDELSSTQLGNLEEELDCKVLDRTLLILDNFCRKSCIGRGKDPGRTGSAQIPGIPSVGTGKITVKTGRRNRYKRSGRKKCWKWIAVLSGSGSVV